MQAALLQVALVLLCLARLLVASISMSTESPALHGCCHAADMLPKQHAGTATRGARDFSLLLLGGPAHEGPLRAGRSLTTIIRYINATDSGDRDSDQRLSRETTERYWTVHKELTKSSHVDMLVSERHVSPDVANELCRSNTLVVQLSQVSRLLSKVQSMLRTANNYKWTAMAIPESCRLFTTFTRS